MLIRHAFPPILGTVLCSLVVSVWACTPTGPMAPPRRASLLNGAALEPAVDLPRLTFARSDGGTFSSADTRGRISLFLFGYSHCPDVCPLTLAEFGQIRRALGNDAARVDMYFVTLDPARDTLFRMREYVANFPGVVGLIGSETELARGQSVFNVVAERHDTGDGGYALDHTAAMYLVNSESQIQLAYPYGTPSEEIVSDIRRLVAASRVSPS